MKEDLRIKRTHKLLSESLIMLMSEKPFEKITVVDICERAMVHRATFYSHFADKYELLKYILQTFEAPFDNEDVTSHDFVGYRKYYLTVASDIIDEIACRKELMATIIRKNQEESFLAGIRYRLTEKILEKLTKCNDNGMDLPVPAEVLARFYAGACMSILEWWIVDGKEVPKEQLVAYLNRLIFIDNLS